MPSRAASCARAALLGPSTASALARMPSRPPLYAHVSGRATRRAPAAAAASTSSHAARTLAATSPRVFICTQATWPPTCAPRASWWRPPPPQARLGIFVLAGSIYEPSPEPGRVYNTSALFGPDGGLLAVYRKIHLFDVTSS